MQSPCLSLSSVQPEVLAWPSATHTTLACLLFSSVSLLDLCLYCCCCHRCAAAPRYILLRPAFVARDAETYDPAAQMQHRLGQLCRLALHPMQASASHPWRIKVSRALFCMSMFGDMRMTMRWLRSWRKAGDSSMT